MTDSCHIRTLSRALQLNSMSNTLKRKNAGVRQEGGCYGDKPVEKEKTVETKSGSVMHLPLDEGRSLHMSGDTYTFKAVGEDTGGALVLLEALVPPQGGPPTHIHRAEDEWFWLLEGELEFMINRHTFMANAGSFVYVPKDTPHRFKNVSMQTARMLAAFMPAGIEGMFFEVGIPATKGSSPSPPDVEEIEKLLATAPRYNVEILPPEQD